MLNVECPMPGMPGIQIFLQHLLIISSVLPNFLFCGESRYSVQSSYSVYRNEWFCFLFAGVLLVFTWCSLQLFQRCYHFQIVYKCVTDTSDIWIVSAKAHCHQSNVSKSTQWEGGGERNSVGKEEALFRWTVCNLGNTGPGRNQKCATLRQRGGQLIQRKCLLWSLTSSTCTRMRNPNFHRLIGPKSTVMIGWNHTSRLVNIKLLCLVDKNVTKR